MKPLGSLDNFTEDESVKSGSFDDNGVRNVKRCVRKGHLVVYTKRENIRVLNDDTNDTSNNNAINEDISGSNSDANSGESLYKTFIFGENGNNNQTEKCIAFWKSIMEKNLLPIKCTIIENKKHHLEQKVLEESLDEKIDLEAEEKANEAVEAVHAEYRRMWMQALKEIQDKKLGEVKLIGKVRCRLCSSMENPMEEYRTEVDEKTVEAEVKNLNKWRSVSTRRRRLVGPNIADEQERRRKYSILSHEKISLPTKKDVQCKQLECQSSEYKFVDKVEEKKRTGIYSKWRSNLVSPPCACGKLECECNTNPAIKSIRATQGVQQKPEEPIEDKNLTTKKDEEKKKKQENVHGDKSIYEEKKKKQENVHDDKSILINVRPLEDRSEYFPASYTSLAKTDTVATIIPTRNLGLEEIELHHSNYDATDHIERKISSILKSTQDLSSTTDIPVMPRTVSMMLPSGEVEVFKREEVTNVEWDKPDLVRKGVSLRNARSSIGDIRESSYTTRGSTARMIRKSTSESGSVNKKHRSPSDAVWRSSVNNIPRESGQENIRAILNETIRVAAEKSASATKTKPVPVDKSPDVSTYQTIHTTAITSKPEDIITQTTGSKSIDKAEDQAIDVDQDTSLSEYQFIDPLADRTILPPQSVSTESVRYRTPDSIAVIHTNYDPFEISTILLVPT